MVAIESNLGPIGFAAAAVLLLCPEVSRADEGGVSFWLPGQYAANRAPGWSTWLTFAISPAAPETAPKRPLIHK